MQLVIILPLQGVWQIAVTNVAFKLDEDLPAAVERTVAIVSSLVLHETTEPSPARVSVKLAVAEISKLRIYEPPTFYEVTSRNTWLDVDIINVWTSERSTVRDDILVCLVFRRIV